MAFTFTRRSPLSVEDAFAAVADVAAHTAHVPLTTVTTDEGSPHVGWGFVAVTGVGRVGFSDRMYLTAWKPPHRFRMVKTGRLLAGWAEIAVAPDGPGSLVTWTEEITLRSGPLSPLTRRIGDALAPRLFGPVLDGLLRDAEATTR